MTQDLVLKVAVSLGEPSRSFFDAGYIVVIRPHQSKTGTDCEIECQTVEVADAVVERLRGLQWERSYETQNKITVLCINATSLKDRIEGKRVW